MICYRYGFPNGNKKRKGKKIKEEENERKTREENEDEREENKEAVGREGYKLGEEDGKMGAGGMERGLMSV